MKKKTMAAFIIILIILLGFAYYFLTRMPTSAPPPIIVKTPKPANTTVIVNKTSNTIVTVNTTKTNSTKTNSTSLDCVSTAATVAIVNGNFGTGTYNGWNVTGEGFLNSSGAAHPLNITYANANNCYYGTPWTNYNGTFFASTYHCGISLSTGNLTSNSFKVREPYLNFRISSAASALLYVELLYKGKPVRVNYYDTLNASGGSNPQSTFVNATMPLLNYVCQNVSVRVVAGVTGGLANKLDYIAVGDFVQSKSNLQTPGALINSTIVGSGTT